MSEQNRPENHAYDNPIIGSPSKEDIIRSIGDERFRKELCEQYGEEKITKLVDNALNL